MSQNHFNHTLPTVTKSRCMAVVKWTVRATIKFTMTNGRGWHGRGEAIIVRRADVEHVHDYARVHCKLRNFLLIRLPMKIGLRTSEICTLTIEDIDFESRSFQVLDSKKKRFFPLPLDVLTLQYIKDLIGSRGEGNVFVREDNLKIARLKKPLSRTAIWYLFHGIGVKAGVQDFSPRMCRHYFATKWFIVEKKSIEGLRRILRHKNLATTTMYLARLVFFEDIQKEYQHTQEPYIDRAGFEPATSQFYHEHCSKCERKQTCKYVDQVSSSPWASGCRFYQTKKEMII